MNLSSGEAVYAALLQVSGPLLARIMVGHVIPQVRKDASWLHCGMVSTSLGLQVEMLGMDSRLELLPSMRKQEASGIGH